MNRTNLALLLLLVGFVIVALPDNNIRLFSLSEDHGPSLQDMVGLLLILGAEIMLTLRVWKQRTRVVQSLGAIGLLIGTFVFSMGLALVIASVTNNAGLWWVAGIVLMILVQALVFYMALK